MAIDITALGQVLATLGGIGAVMGAGLAAASQKFAVEIDPRIEEALGILPGINCGACGYPGCSGYAQAVIEEADVKISLCSPGGASVAEKLAVITGKTPEKTSRKTAILKCVQDKSKGSSVKYEYSGLEDCAAVETLHRGAFNCTFACVGLGNCAAVCPVDAIVMDKGRPQINPEKCIACGMCVKTCPRDVLTLVDFPGKVQVYCRNTKKPNTRKKICPSACIGCSLCLKNCPWDAIEMIEMVAVVHHEKCPPDCEKPCLSKCPTKAILGR
ncbi:MAG: RnfABCDGE type electron transport complex subunit B [Firmicutes bacterium]|nr:RnfABCDGE type electron transport complex subunit B [Bacillota bacterium]